MRSAQGLREGDERHNGAGGRAEAGNRWAPGGEGQRQSLAWAGPIQLLEPVPPILAAQFQVAPSEPLLLPRGREYLIILYLKY